MSPSRSLADQGPREPRSAQSRRGAGPVRQLHLIAALVLASLIAACAGPAPDEAADEPAAAPEEAAGQEVSQEEDAPAESNELDAWLEQAGLGPYAPEEEDWEAVHQAAQDEPPLVVYGSTSRVDGFVEEFQNLWPGVEAETVQVGGPDMIERLNREWEAGLRDVGVVDLAGPESYDALPAGSVVGYVPPELRDQLREQYQDPVLTVAISLSGWAYNPQVSPAGPPFDSLWDLTTEEFRGQVILTDPTASSSAGEQLIGTVARADELEADYEATYGRALELEERDAGFEWLRRLLENDPHVVDDWRPAAEALTNQTDNVIAQMNFIRMSSVEDGTYSMQMATGITPSDAVSSPRWQGIGAFTASPNAAKLFVYSMMTEEVVAEGYYTSGFMSPRADWVPAESWMEPMTEFNFWDPVSEFTQNHGHEVIDFWQLHSRG